MDLNFFFDEAKGVMNITSESELARAIGLTPQELYRARKDGHIKSEVLLKLAELSSIEVRELLVAREASKAKEPAARAAWETVLQRVGAAIMPSSVSLQPVDFTAKTGVKDYRKLQKLFSFKALAVEMSKVFGTVARLFPRQPIPIIPVMVP